MIEMTTKDIGKHLKTLRKAKCLTLAEVSGLSGVSVSHLSGVERGAGDISLSRLISLLDIYEYKLSLVSKNDDIDIAHTLWHGGYMDGLSVAITRMKQLMDEGDNTI